MVDQYRHGSGSVTREFPAGLTDEGEDEESAAKRELLEETGMIGDLLEIASFNPNPAFMTNRQSFFLGTNLKKCLVRAWTRWKRLKSHTCLSRMLYPKWEAVSMITA